MITKTVTGEFYIHVGATRGKDLFCYFNVLPVLLIPNRVIFRNMLSLFLRTRQGGNPSDERNVRVGRKGSTRLTGE
jgi:hypothetical protein